MNKYFKPEEWLDRADSSKSGRTASATESANTFHATDPEDDYFHRVLNFITEQGIDITADRNDWSRFALAIANSYGEAGRADFHQLSRNYPAYSYEECDTLYSDCLRRANGGNSVGSIVYWARQHGLQLPSETPNSCLKRDKKDKKDKKEVLSFSNATFASDDFLPTFVGDVLSQLPPWLRELISRKHDPREQERLLLGALAFASSVMVHLWGPYNGREVRSNLFVTIVGRAGSGKGDIAPLDVLVEPLQKEMREQYHREREAYDRQQQRLAESRGLGAALRTHTLPHCHGAQRPALHRPARRHTASPQP